MPNPDCRLLPWDSEFFGKRIARLTRTLATQDEMDKSLLWCRSQQVDCLYYLCPADDPDAIRVAENQEFNLVDVRIELKITFGSAAATARLTEGEPLIRRNTPADLEALVALAGNAFLSTRFSNDPGFGPEAASQLYRYWIKQDCQNPAATVLVCVADGRISGFVSFEPGGNPTPSIGLIAVEHRMRGQGVGRALIEACKEHCQRAGRPGLRVVTQASNTAAVRLYEGCAFRVSSVGLWYHKWFTGKSALYPRMQDLHQAKG